MTFYRGSLVSKLGAFLPLVLLTQCSTGSVSVGLSAYSDGIKSRATSESGSEGFLGPLVYPFSVKVTPAVDVSGFAFFTDYTLFARTSPEGEVKNRYLIMRAPYKFTVLPGGHLSLLFGPQVKFHTQSGSGAPVSLNNGNSTATFGTPSRSVTDGLVSINFGLLTQIDAFTFTLESSLEGFASSSKRNFTLLVGLSYLVY